MATRYVSYTENGVNIRVRKVLDSAGNDFLLVSIDGGKWEDEWVYPTIDAWGIWHDFAE